MSADEITVASKRCPTCKETKAVSAFGRDSKKKDGLRSECKECVREYARVWRAANSEKVRERNRVYYAANPEKVNEKSRVYRAANPEKVREYARVYYAANPDKVNEAVRVWQAANPEKGREASRVYRKANPDKVREGRRVYYAANSEKLREKNRVYRVANSEKVRERKRVYNAANPEKGRVHNQRRRARKANLPNTLTAAEWYYAIDYFHGCCAVCGRQLKNLDKTRRGSADHWIPLTKGGGTTADNIVPLCSGEDGCNNRKGNKDPEVWLAQQFSKHEAKKILQRINAYFELVKAKDKEVA